MSKAKGLAPRVLRVVLLFAALYAIVVVWVAHRAKADVQEIMLGLGAEMLHYPDAREGRVRRLSLNGASIYMRTATSDRLVPEALDYFESRCNQRDGRVLEQFQELEAEGHLDLGELDPAEADSTLRFETSARGFVSCLDMGEGRQGYEGLLDRVGAFVESGDLSRVGQMRYVYAERVGEGEEESSFLLSFWSEGELNIYEMFPAAGDAPGVDPADVPRPASSRRILSMVEEGRSYGMTL
ncbi:MAG: hypothetical protein OEY14_06065, partial [Myxococcales bacterium]|nr:hypothetical protein [Myxococcales bacterium]